MRFLHKFIEDQFVSNLVNELDSFIDERRNRIFRQFHRTEEYQKMAAEIARFREKLSSLDAELLEQYETVVMQEPNYISSHEYLQGMIDGIALRNVFHSLHLNDVTK